MLIQVSTSLVNLGQVKLGYDRLSGYVKLVQVMSGYVT
jgi:hypothetical protein